MYCLQEKKDEQVYNERVVFEGKNIEDFKKAEKYFNEKGFSTRVLKFQYGESDFNNMVQVFQEK